MTFAQLVGIINVTPDSFSDGSLYSNRDAAVSHGLQLIDQGADILDIGGESTRPGADLVPPIEEQSRVIPVIAELRRLRPSTPISIDTRNSSTATLAVEAGAAIVNDVSAGLYDEAMLSTVASLRVPLILMHMKGQPKTMQTAPEYDDVVREVFDFLHDRIVAAMAAGISSVIADVGIGFGKTTEHNIELLRHHQAFQQLGVPLMLGISRKRFIGSICGIDDPAQRDVATALLHTLLIGSGASYLRVHNVQYLVQLRRILEAFEL